MGKRSDLPPFEVDSKIFKFTDIDTQHIPDERCDSNVDKVNRATKMVNFYAIENISIKQEDLETVCTDLLTDFTHFMRCAGLDVDHVLRMASDAHEAERMGML